MMKGKDRYQTYVRKDGSVGYIVDTRNSEGRKVRKTFDRLVDADEFYEKTRRDRRRVGAGLDPLIEDIRVSVFGAQWLERREAEGRPKSSEQATEQRFRRYIKPMIGHMIVSRVQSHQVEKLLSDLIPKYGISIATRNKVRGVLYTFFEDAIKLRHAHRNPVKETKNIKVTEEKWSVWNSAVDVQKFLETAQCDVARWFFPLSYLMVHTGIRIGEALALRWDEDVNLTEGWAHIHRTYEKESMAPVERTKGKRMRWVGLNVSTIEVLKAFRESRPKLLAGQGAPVFTWDDGRIVHPRRAIKVMYRVCERAEVKRIRLHDLRHQYATMFTQAKGNRYALQRLLGHSSFAMVDRYSHLDPSYLREQANVVEIRIDSSASKMAQNASIEKVTRISKSRRNNALSQ